MSSRNETCKESIPSNPDTGLTAGATALTGAPRPRIAAKCDTNGDLAPSQPAVLRLWQALRALGLASSRMRQMETWPSLFAVALPVRREAAKEISRGLRARASYPRTEREPSSSYRDSGTRQMETWPHRDSCEMRQLET